MKVHINNVFNCHSYKTLRSDSLRIIKENMPSVHSTGKDLSKDGVLRIRYVGDKFVTKICRWRIDFHNPQ